MRIDKSITSLDIQQYLFQETNNKQQSINYPRPSLRPVRKRQIPISQLLQFSRYCIEKLQRSPSQPKDNKDTYDIDIFSGLDVSELSTIRQNEKHFVFKQLIKNLPNCQQFSQTWNHNKLKNNQQMLKQTKISLCGIQGHITKTHQINDQQ